MFHEIHQDLPFVPPPPPPPPPPAPPAAPPMRFAENEMRDLNHRLFGMNIRDVRPPNQASMPLRMAPKVKDTQDPLVFEQHSFTKVKPTGAGYVETWAFTQRKTDPFSQGDLKARVQKQKTKKRVQDQYEDADMEGFKRRQVDRLIRDRNDAEVPWLEWTLAAIKLDKEANGRRTKAMQVVLQRKKRTGPPGEPRLHFPLWKTTDLVDLRDEDHRKGASLGGSTFPREAFAHVPHHFPPDPSNHDFDGPNVHLHGHAPQQSHGLPDSNMPEGPAKKDQGKARDKPKIIQVEPPRSRMKRHSTSESETSFESDLSSDVYTDVTPDSLFSSESGYNIIEKKHEKDRRHSHHNPGPFDRGHRHRGSQYSREHKRKDPAPTQHYKRYSQDGIDIVPASLHRRRRSSTYHPPYLNDRPNHSRLPSYEDESRLMRQPLDRRPPLYDRRSISGYDLPRDRPRIGGGLDLEWEERNERERRIREEVQLLDEERALERLERARADRFERENHGRGFVDRLNRDQYEPRRRSRGLTDLADYYDDHHHYRR